MRVVLLASGSKGNSLLVCIGRTRLLIDSGLAARELLHRLALVDIDPESIDAILVTHEHIDHVRGLGAVERRLKRPVYLHHEVASTLADQYRLNAVSEFASGQEIHIGEVLIRPFAVTHDARATVGFTLAGSCGKVGVVTDLGVVTRLVCEELKGCHSLVIEANHDEEMLRDGPYPWKLKQRIRSRHGHLSNRESAELLGSLCWEGLESVFLAHLSETNNHPELAETVARDTLARQTCCAPQLLLGRQDRPTSLT